jgi:hypothetical protein
MRDMKSFSIFSSISMFCNPNFVSMFVHFFLSFYSLVTGNRADEEVNIYSTKKIDMSISISIKEENKINDCCDLMQTVDRLIETGKSEQIFKDAIQEQGRGQVGYLLNPKYKQNLSRGKGENGFPLSLQKKAQGPSVFYVHYNYL